MVYGKGELAIWMGNLAFLLALYTLCISRKNNDPSYADDILHDSIIYQKRVLGQKHLNPLRSNLVYMNMEMKLGNEMIL